MCDVVYPFGQALGMFAPSSVWVFVFTNVEGYENVCVCVCVSEMLCMCDVVYPFGQALGMFAPSCLCV